MSYHEPLQRIDSTSAAGAMVNCHRCAPALAGIIIFAGLSTSSAQALTGDTTAWTISPSEQTTAGTSVALVEQHGAAIAELHRLTGLTWEQLARLFMVSRRALHFWASGKSMTPANEEHLQRLLAVIHTIDRGSASANRTMLLTVLDDATIPFDLLSTKQYSQVIALLGPGEALRTKAPKRSAEEVVAARTPRPPAELAEALQDRVHPASGRLLDSKPVLLGRRK